MLLGIGRGQGRLLSRDDRAAEPVAQFPQLCVEFVAATAWLAELFADPKQRERVLGYTQALSSVGGILVTAANWLCVQYGQSLPAIYGTHEAWRYTLMSGVIPALPLIFIRPFLPESPAWQQKKEAGTLKRPSIAELFAPGLRQATIVTTVIAAVVTTSIRRPPDCLAPSPRTCSRPLSSLSVPRLALAPALSPLAVPNVTE